MRLSEPSASAMAISPPEELLMEEVSALVTAGAANGAETESIHRTMHGCEVDETKAIGFNLFSVIACHDIRFSHNAGCQMTCWQSSLKNDSRMGEPSASAMAFSPEALLMEEVSAVVTAGAANGAETVSNDIMHGCD